MRIAAIDIGTNTVLALVIEASSNGELTVLLDRHAIARLGEGVDKTGRISEEAEARFRKVLREHLDAIAPLRVDRMIALATSAMRDARNRDEIIERAQEEFGLNIEVISGNEESALTFCGALFNLSLPLDNKIAVVDIGGGSTEISFGTPTEFDSGESLEMGAVRITERYLTEHSLAIDTVQHAIQFIDEKLSRTKRSTKIHSLIAVAGTPTSLAAMGMQLAQFDARRIHGYKLSAVSIDRLIMEMRSLDVAGLLEKYPMLAGRADILLGGSLILREVMRTLAMDSVRVSTCGLRYGIALRELERATNDPR